MSSYHDDIRNDLRRTTEASITTARQYCFEIGEQAVRDILKAYIDYFNANRASYEMPEYDDIDELLDKY